MSLSAIPQVKQIRVRLSGVRRRVVPRGPARILRVIHERFVAKKEMRYLRPTIKQIRPFSMVPQAGLVHLGHLVRYVLANGISGNFVECGVWRGGASFLIADLLRRAGVRDRKVWMFDSFEGHRRPEEIDGPAALAYAQNPDNPEYHDNCRVSFQDVKRSASELGLVSYTELVKGWFEETLPASRERIGPIAILRVDCDWYKSVRCCLNNLYDQVAQGGFVVFDDYYDYEGCVIAVYEFLAERRLAHRLETANRIAFFRKL